MARQIPTIYCSIYALLYDSKFFCTISIRSSPMTLLHRREFHGVKLIVIALVVKLQIIEAGRIFYKSQ